jgi:hypothetical protein
LKILKGYLRKQISTKRQRRLWVVSDLGNSFQSSDLMFQVNCLEPHPNLPAMATSGLDHSVKIWLPTSTKEPDVKAIENVSNQFNHMNVFYFAFLSLR